MRINRITGKLVFAYNYANCMCEIFIYVNRDSTKHLMVSVSLDCTLHYSGNEVLEWMKFHIFRQCIECKNLAVPIPLHLSHCSVQYAVWTSTYFPNCTLHTVITHMITVLERQSLMGIRMTYSMRKSAAPILQSQSDFSVHCANWT